MSWKDIFKFLLIVTLLLNETENRRINRKRTQRVSIFHQQGQHCKTVKQLVHINIPGCTPTRFITIGCRGYCKSETFISYYRRRMISKVFCCKPTKELKFQSEISCSNVKGGLRNITMIAAIECSCTPCEDFMNSSIKL